MANVPQVQETFFSVFSTSNDSTLVPPTVDLIEAICFELKDYKEIVYNSPIRKTLCLPIEILTNESEDSRIAIKNKKILENFLKGEIKIPRPQNAFIIYRRDQAERLGIKCSPAASKRIAKMWNDEPSDVKLYFQALAMMAKENHTKKYGKNYKYQPKRKLKKIGSPKQTCETQTPAELKVTPPSPSSSIKEYQIPPAEDLSLIITNVNIDSWNFGDLSPLSTNDYPTPPTIVSSDDEDINTNINLEDLMNTNIDSWNFGDLSPLSTNDYPTPIVSSDEEDIYTDFTSQAFPNLEDIAVTSNPPSDSDPFFTNASMLASYGCTENAKSPLEDNPLVNSDAPAALPMDFDLYPPISSDELTELIGNQIQYIPTEYCQSNEAQHMTNEDFTFYNETNTLYDFQFDDETLYQDFFNYYDQAIFSYDDYSLQ